MGARKEVASAARESEKRRGETLAQPPRKKKAKDKNATATRARARACLRTLLLLPSRGQKRSIAPKMKRLASVSSSVCARRAANNIRLRQKEIKRAQRGCVSGRGGRNEGERQREGERCASSRTATHHDHELYATSPFSRPLLCTTSATRERERERESERDHDRPKKLRRKRGGGRQKGKACRKSTAGSKVFSEVQPPPQPRHALM